MQRIGKQRKVLVKQASSLLSTGFGGKKTGTITTTLTSPQQLQMEHILSSMLRFNNNNKNIISLPLSTTTSSLIREFHTNYRNYKKNEKNDEEEKEEKDENKEDDESGEKQDAKSKKLRIIVALVLGTYLLLYLTPAGPSQGAKQSKEITFQEFVERYLGNTNLDHLEYDLRTNEVYVYLKDEFNAGSFVYKQQQHGDESHNNNNGEEVKKVQVIVGKSSSDPKHKGSIWGPSSGFNYFFQMINVDAFESRLQDGEIEKGIPPSMSPKIVYTGSLDWHSLLPSPFTLFLAGILMWSLTATARGGMPGLGGITKTPEAVKQKVKVTFNDVAGMDEAKAEIQEFVSFLKKPDHYKKLGAKIPRGAILMGPPGTGKTLLAKAVAGESNVPFYSMSGSDFVEMFVGVGPARVRNLFKKARETGEAIIFIDEIDAIGRPRGNSMYGGGNDERENTLNQLLVEMDGFNENQNVIVLASTNVDVDGLDRALLRPGRFDRQITVDKPDQKGREDVFKVHLRKIKKVDKLEENIPRLAELTPGFTGADIANVCNEGAIFAAREGKKEVDMEDMERAIDRVIGGIEKRTAPISQKEKKVIAYHEAGHALASWFCKHSDPLLKISIIPRGKALGYAQYVPKEYFIRTKDHLVDYITQALGGRVAEKIIFNHLSTGAQDDLQKVTRIAYAAVSSFGMSDIIGPVSYPLPGDPSMAFQKPYSEDTAEKIDSEVNLIIQDALNRTSQILTEKKDLLEIVAQYLLKHETMNIEQFRELVGPSPFADKEQKFREFIEKKELQKQLENEKQSSAATTEENKKEE